MLITILDDQRYSGEGIKPGDYEITRFDLPTEKQNRTFHALLQIFWTSGCHSYNAKNFRHFKELIKLSLGAGAEKYQSLVDDNGKPLQEPVIRYRIKSWRDYSKFERANAIDNLIAEMIQADVSSAKFEEVLKSLADNQLGGVK